MGFPNIYVAYGDIFICWCFKKLVLRRFLLVKTPEFSGYRFVLAAKSDAVFTSSLIFTPVLGSVLLH